MNLLNHCPGIFPRLNFSICVSGLLCEFVQPLLVHIFLSQLFNYCCVHHIFLLSAKIASNRTEVFIPIESYLMFLAQKLMSPSPISFSTNSLFVPWICFLIAKNTIIKSVMTFETGMSRLPKILNN